MVNCSNLHIYGQSDMLTAPKIVGVSRVEKEKISTIRELDNIHTK